VHAIPFIDEGVNMSSIDTRSLAGPEAPKLLAQIAQVYVETLAGLRRPEQLARWLSDAAYYDLCHRVAREYRGRQLMGVTARPIVRVRRSKFFSTDRQALMAVVLLEINDTTRAMSIRVEVVNTRLRIVDLILI
jgi:hypothetical protein